MINDEIRLEAVNRFKHLVLDTDTEFKVLLNMASEVCETPMAMITLLDKDTQWLKVAQGTDVKQTPASQSLCSYTIMTDEVFAVSDTSADSRLTGNPNLSNTRHLRFYAGAPLITKDGQRIGSLCVVDVQPHQQLTKQQELMLQMLAKQAIGLMEHRIAIEMLEQNKIAFERQQEIIRQAAISQRSFFESAPNFHILLNKKGEVVDFNKVAYAFIEKVHKAELKPGVIFKKYIAPDFLSKFLNGFTIAISGKNTFEEGSTDYGAHGIIYWEASFETARDPDNEITGVSYIIRDVSDRKSKEIKILEQNRSLLKLAHQQAHEFRAPLTTIVGMMELIKAEDFNAPREYYDMLEQSVALFDNKIKEIVHNIDGMVAADSYEVYG